MPMKTIADSPVDPEFISGMWLIVAGKHIVQCAWCFALGEQCGHYF